ncbi:MAG: hypothetical protein WD398_13170 [Cyclobacteriaceae bacterium]
MLKYTFETQDQELKTWVDPENGSLNIQIGGETVHLPNEIGMELIAVLRQKQSIFKDIERKKVSAWNRFLESISGEEVGTSREMSKRQFKAA